MTVKKILATQFGRLSMACVGLILAGALIYIGGKINNPIAISAGLLAVAAGAVLVSMDLAIFLRSTNQILEMVEPIYAQHRLQIEGTAKPLAMKANDEWTLDMAFIEPAQTEKPLTAKAAKYGNIEFRTFSPNDGETDLERIERISKETGTAGLRKKLLVSKVGTTLIDEASLGDYVEGHLSFKQLAFPEIVPGFDLLAAEDALKFRRASTWREALQLASGDYDRTIVIVREDELRSYQDLMGQETQRPELKSVKVEAIRL